MSSVASILKSRVVNGNLVASIDGQYIKAATNLPQAIPALANVVSINPTTGELAYQAAGGGGGGPFLPLAGGTMDALPNGVISAHTIEDIITLEGTPAGSGLDTTIITNTGNDLNLQTGNADGLNVDTGQMTIDAAIRTEINATTVIQPVGGYAYPNNPEIGLEVKNWIHPAGGQQIGTQIFNIQSVAGQADGLNVFQIKSGVGAVSHGIRVNDIGQNGATTDALGVDITNIQGDNTTYGVRVDSVNGNAFSVGVSVSGVSDAVGDGNGLSINNIAGSTEARGAYIQNITANGSTAIGIEIDGVSANGAGQDGRGVSVNNMVSDGNCVGVEARVLDSTSQTTTGFRASLLTAAGQVFGGRFSSIGTLSGISEAYGLDMANVRQNPAVVGTIGRGVNMNSIEAYDAAGVDINVVYGNQRAVGVNINDVKTTNVAVPAYGLSASRGSKLAAATGQLMRLIDGNLGLAVQYLNNPIAPQQVFGDAGNLCVIDVGAPAGPASINLVAPPGGWEDGHWFLFVKVAAVGHGIVDTAGNPINGAGAFVFPPGVAYDMCLMFFSVALGGWVANAF